MLKRKCCDDKGKLKVMVNCIVLKYKGNIKGIILVLGNWIFIVKMINKYIYECFFIIWIYRIKVWKYFKICISEK